MEQLPPPTIHPIRGALIDLSGTIHVAERAIPGAIQACSQLHQLGISVRFLTNTTKMSSVDLLDQLRRIGFEEDSIPPDSILTSTRAARDYLLRHHLRPLCLVEESLLADLVGVERNEEDPNCILIGLAPDEFNYQRLNQAFRVLLKNKSRPPDPSIPHHSPLIAIHRGKYFRDSDDELSLGPGGFVACLETALDLQALVIGKPAPSFFQEAVRQLGCAPEEVIMVGDDAVQDICGAMTTGIGHGILVRTGKYQPGDEDKIPLETLVVHSIVEAVSYITSHVQRTSRPD